jgi:hypothetical protein
MNGRIIGDLIFFGGSKYRNSHTGEFALGYRKITEGKVWEKLIETLIAWAKTNEIEKICLQFISGNEVAI